MLEIKICVSFVQQQVFCFVWIQLHYTHRGTHNELLYAARFFVTAADVVTEAFAGLSW